jgi:hypothetical protein
LDTVRDRYEAALLANGKSGTDSIISRLNEMTGANMPCFEPELQPAQFFTRSWVVSLHLLPEELKRLVTLVILDAVSSFLLEQADSPVSGGYRVLRHLLIVDEARKTLRERRSESLVDLIRQGRSKGSVVMLLSQDPSDFEGETDDFTNQLGTVVAFACNQSKRGLGALEGVFGRGYSGNFVATKAAAFSRNIDERRGFKLSAGRLELATIASRRTTLRSAALCRAGVLDWPWRRWLAGFWHEHGQRTAKTLRDAFGHWQPVGG